MVMNSKSIIHDLKTLHFPNTPAERFVIQSKLDSIRLHIPQILMDIWEAMNGVNLFDPISPPYQILGIEEFCSLNDHFEIEDASLKNWFLFCDIQDGNFISVDLSDKETTPCFDIFHEDWPDFLESTKVADSLESFLTDALNSSGEHYWL